MESNLRHAPSSIEQSFVFRPLDLKHVDDGMLPLEDSVFASALTRLQKLESLVKKKIFILNAFHNINPKITALANEYLKYGQIDPKVGLLASC